LGLWVQCAATAPIIVLYYARICFFVQIKGQQDDIRRIFDTKNIEYKEIDIAAPNCADDKKFMQEVVREANPDILAIPPQLFQDEAYRGVSVISLPSIGVETGDERRGARAPHFL